MDDFREGSTVLKVVNCKVVNVTTSDFPYKEFQASFPASLGKGWGRSNFFLSFGLRLIPNFR